MNKLIKNDQIKLFDYFKRIRGNISVKNRLIFVNMKSLKYSNFKITVRPAIHYQACMTGTSEQACLSGDRVKKR